MEFQKFNDPWLHYVIPDILPHDMFRIAYDVAYSKLDFTKAKDLITNYLEQDVSFHLFFKEHYCSFCEKLKITPVFPIRFTFQYSLYNNSDDFDRYDNGIHTDSFSKQFSCLIPLSNFGSGTMLYDEQRNFVKQIDWKQNHAFIFANKPNHFHAVGKANGTARCLLNAIAYPRNYAMIHEKLYNLKRPTDHLNNKT